MRLVGAIVALAGLMGSMEGVNAQQVENNGCLRLLGSVACPGCESCYPFASHQ